MDKRLIYLLQKIDCNCNDCAFMTRDIDRRRRYDELHKDTAAKQFRVHYGNCEKLKKTVSFISGICQLDTQECFVHRKDSNCNG